MQPDVLTAFRAWQRRAHAALPGLPGGSPLALADVVPLTVQVDQPRAPSPTSLAQAIAAGPPGLRLALRGLAGSGKTTLARHLAATAEDAIVLYLPGWRLAEGHPFDVIQADMRAACGPRAALGLADALRAAGPAVCVVVDAAPSDRFELRGLGHGLGEPKLVALTRENLLESGTFGDFWEGRLLPLEPAGQATLLALHAGPDADRLGRHLARTEGLHRLARVPGALALFAADRSPRLPTRPVQVFQRTLDALLAPLADPAAARRVLQALALALYETADADWPREVVIGTLDALGRGEVVGARAPFADDLRPPRGAIAGWLAATGLPAARLFLRRAGEATGLLAEAGGRWRAWHPALLDTLYAEHLARHGRAIIAGRARELGNSPRFERVLARTAELAPRPVGVLSALSDARTQNVALRTAGVGPRALCARRGMVDILDALARRFAHHPPGLAYLRSLAHPGADLERCAQVHHALTAIGQGEPDADFFARIGRPMPDHCPLATVVVRGGRTVVGPRYVHLSPYRLSRTVVTQGELRALDPTATAAASDDHPAQGVTWYRAWLYARWVGGRLPTEAEWEHACRAGTDGPWSCDEDALPDHAWFSPSGAWLSVQPVARKRPNPWGLYDMHGNVWEWCADWWRPWAFAEERDPQGPADGILRVIRGGSAQSGAGDCRSGARIGYGPGAAPTAGGFRVVLPAEPATS
ncbi:MAG: SUMF1/EgtB/PvdO family nonheme iron enzyme [bacterium]